MQACYADLQYIHAEDPQRITRTWKSGNFQADPFLLGMDAAASYFFCEKIRL